MFISTLFLYPLMGIDHIDDKTGFKDLENITLFLESSTKVSVGCLFDKIKDPIFDDAHLYLSWTLIQLTIILALMFFYRKFMLNFLPGEEKWPEIRKFLTSKKRKEKC